MPLFNVVLFIILEIVKLDLFLFVFLFIEILCRHAQPVLCSLKLQKSLIILSIFDVLGSFLSDH